jgi:transposase-like protein
VSLVFVGSGCLNLGIGSIERGIMPKRCPDEFRRKVLDLVLAGRPIKHVAEGLGISIESIYRWRKQNRIDHGLALAVPRWRRLNFWLHAG